jgi:hypothetical protein
MMSASAPAGRPSRNTGSRLATCTRLTISGDGASEVISHPAPVFCIHMPVLLHRFASQSIRKARWRRGARALGSGMPAQGGSAAPGLEAEPGVRCPIPLASGPRFVKMRP